ncbi:serine/threonine-protein kinase [Catenulispora yoronensis]
MADDVLDGRYRLVRLLGRGGMGEVWRAHDARIGREVAVKIVTAGGLTDEALARFDREARIAGNLSGPSIVTVHDYGHDEYSGETVPYLVMELVAGRTIAERVRHDGPQPPETALRWAQQVCEALTIAHAANVVHRDIKPSNVMVTDSGAVKVLDFGIARFVENQQTRTGLTAAGMVIGSVEYMSPEQAQGGRVDARSDLYSLGCLLFFTLTARGPFEADTPMGLAYQHVTKPAEAPSRYQMGIPPEVDELVLALLAKEPQDRPADARTVGERIGVLLGANKSGGGESSAAAAGSTAATQGPASGAQAAAGVAGAAAGAAAAQSSGPATGPGPAQAAAFQSPTGAGHTSVMPQTGSMAIPTTQGPGPSTPPPPTVNQAERDTGFWTPGQDTQVTEVRHYPGSGAPPPGRPMSGPAAPQPQPDRSHGRRWFLAGAVAVAAGGAGVGTWLAVGKGANSANSPTGHDSANSTADGTPSSPATGSGTPKNSASAAGTAPSSSAGATTAASSASSPSSPPPRAAPGPRRSPSRRRSPRWT